MRKITAFRLLLPAISLILFTEIAAAAPPALMTASFIKQELNFSECQSKATGIMEKLHLEIEDHGNGTVLGFGDQSVASVNCHKIEDKVFVQIAVSSQKQEAAELIMGYVIGFLKNKANQPSGSTPALSKMQGDK